MDYRSLLNERQFEAVSTPSQYTRVVAGAGSGKTRVLTYRIAWLISEKSVPPERILAFAFTNKVADEMRTRALALLSGGGALLRVSTFHSFCARFLRQEIGVLGFPSNYTIMDEEDQLALLKSVAVEMGLRKNDENVKPALNFIDHAKCEGRYPEDIRLGKFVSENEKTRLNFYRRYETRKNEMFALDFGDLILRAIEILEEFPDIKEKWRRRYSHILIDEFQDVNDVQYKLVKLLAADTTSLYVVGDPDQTIYTWRGADQAIIMNFAKDFHGAKTIILDRNYRSTKTILDTANALIRHNRNRVPKNLYTKNEKGQPVLVEACYSREGEAKYVADQIEFLRNTEKGFRYRDVAILYRASYVTLTIEKEFMRRKIPYQIFGSVKFFERREVKDVLAYFRLVYNPRDDVSFERIVNIPRRGIGDVTMDTLKAERSAAGMSYVEYIKNIERFDTRVKAKHIMSLTFMIGKLDEARDKLKENLEAYPAILEKLIEDLGVLSAYGSDDEDVDRLGNVKALFNDISDYFDRYPESTYEDYLENATLQTSQDEIKNGNYVALMTIHVAKGLEFPYVFLISLNEGIFPSEKTLAESGRQGLEEERRLCYVAFTRAKKKLYLTCNTGYSFIQGARMCPSRFFAEAELFFAERPPLRREHAFEGEKNQEEDKGYYPDEISVAYPLENGITDWRVGDLVEHKKFGPGKVVELIGDSILVIDFERCGRKSIAARHFMLKRREKGAEA